MNPKQTSVFSTLANLALTILKFIAGFFTHSVALMAEALHSGLDIASSFITYLGVRASDKPADSEHPYGHGGYEGIASFSVALLLFISAIWIAYEALSSLIGKKGVAEYSLWGIGLMALSAVVNEILARLKFNSSTEFSSLALASDAEHSRADVYSSLAVLVGLFLIKYFKEADSVLAIIVAVYILYEAIQLSREAIDTLVDKANLQLEEQIRQYLLAKNIQYSTLKTRQIGSSSFAEIALNFKPGERAETIIQQTKSLEQDLLNHFGSLKQVSLTVSSLDYRESSTRPHFGGRFNFHQSLETIGPPKESSSAQGKIERTVIPISGEEIAEGFSSQNYLLLDRDQDQKLVRQKLILNPFYEEGSNGRGAKFVKAVLADRVMAKQIGQQAKQNLEGVGIKVEIVKPDFKIGDLNLPPITYISDLENSHIS